MSERWLVRLGEELGVEGEIPTEALLDAARVVAHTVERKAAPLTTYLIGLAASSDPQGAEAICRRVIDLARAEGADG
jgi:hypothetical protein